MVHLTTGLQTKRYKEQVPLEHLVWGSGFLETRRCYLRPTLIGQRREGGGVFYSNTRCCWSSRVLVKLLMGPMALSDMALSRPHSRLGPNTTARLLLVILLISLLSAT